MSFDLTSVATPSSHKYCRWHCVMRNFVLQQGATVWRAAVPTPHTLSKCLSVDGSCDMNDKMDRVSHVCNSCWFIEGKRLWSPMSWSTSFHYNMKNVVNVVHARITRNPCCKQKILSQEINLMPRTILRFLTEDLSRSLQKVHWTPQCSLKMISWWISAAHLFLSTSTKILHKFLNGHIVPEVHSSWTGNTEQGK